MRNLQRETLDAIVRAGKTVEDIAYCSITIDVNYKQQELLKGKILDIDKLDFMYENGYGSQKINGFIVFNDKTWLERSEYDGSEWWDYRKCPSKPKGVQCLINI